MDWDSPTTEKHIAEAKARGCELLGEGKDFNHRRYRLPCGHEQEVQIGNMRSSQPRCFSCVTGNLRAEAEANGCVLLGQGVNRNYRTYRLTCGHRQEIQTSRMRTGSFRCKNCLENMLQEEAKTRGCQLLGPGNSTQNRLYQLPCDHQQVIQPTRMRRGSFRCQTCLDIKSSSEAEVQGCELLGSGRRKDYKSYRLPCGHVDEVQTVKMRRGV